jgi:hypothetical protein
MELADNAPAIVEYASVSIEMNYLFPSHKLIGKQFCDEQGP